MSRYGRTIDWTINHERIPERARPDIKQDVALKMLVRFRRYGVPESDELWSTRNACFDWLRKERSAAFLLRGEKPLEPVSHYPDPVAQLIKKDEHERLHRAAESLPRLQREVLKRVMMERTHGETAKRCGSCISTVKVAGHRGCARLRKLLAAR